MEDGTWEKEIQQFFKNSGSTFDPIRVLHGAVLDEFRSESLRGRETRAIEATYHTAGVRCHSFQYAVRALFEGFVYPETPRALAAW